MVRILIADPLEESGLDILRNAGAEVVVLAPADKPRLRELLADCDAIVVRSATKVTRELLDAASRLRVVGRAGIGVDNVDVEAATEKGILVVNAPTANLLSAVEHTFAMMLACARNVPAADASMKRGEWDRKSFVGVELQGKTLGILGFGRIGQRVAARARAFEMKVVAHDPFLDPAVARRLDVEPVALDGLLELADVVTLHTPLTKETKNLLSAEGIARLKPGAIVVNCGRGGTLDEEALLAALEADRLGGAALDVFEEEPTPRQELIRHRRVIATPHIGAQTREAQERIAVETATQLLAALEGSMPAAAVNLPFSPAGRRAEPYLRLGERLGRIASELVGGGIRRVEVELAGVEDDLATPVSVAVLKGALATFLGPAVNYVNAEHLATGRGIELVRTTRRDAGGYPHLVRVRATGGGDAVDVGGVIFGESDLRVVDFLGYRLEFRPEGRLLVLENQDVPGVVGRIGTALGAAGVNIADIHLARRGELGAALSVLRVDHEPSAAALDRLRSLDGISSVRTLGQL
ncbi:MAG: phosphoglycerate dehydrogenase [Acidobacteria bacterium]|nr:phosphoglycerate dehydrogenase [Acidobacteriota bacterium]MCB9378413.1 phosphoglycerate dehydrogenase [Holophagales bacterium]